MPKAKIVWIDAADLRIESAYHPDEKAAQEAAKTLLQLVGPRVKKMWLELKKEGG